MAQNIRPELVLPRGIDRSQALAVVRQAPAEYQQALLDTLAGLMQNREIDSAIGYLRKMVHFSRQPAFDVAALAVASGRVVSTSRGKEA